MRGMATRDHVAVLLYALEQGYDAVPDHVVRLALADVAAAGFDPAARGPLPDQVAGLSWRGRMLTAGELVPPAELSYFRHVLGGQEWPAGTTLADYLRSLRDVLLDPASGAFIAREAGSGRLGVARRAGPLRGATGGEWVLVVHDPAAGHWVHGWQPPDGLAAIAGGDWSDVSWLRVPR